MGLQKSRQNLDITFKKGYNMLVYEHFGKLYSKRIILAVEDNGRSV